MEIQIRIKKGILEGTDCGSCMVFRGVPYAKPPIGELRWKPPMETEPWEGVKKAERFGNIAIQTLPTGKEPWGQGYYKEFYSDPSYIPPMSEDCLYLNIWAPKKETDSQADIRKRRAPVAFWIHGGGFSGGYSSEIEFDGEACCEKGVILVTVEYRVNVFGFLAHPWLSAEDPHSASGNYGILDQIAALKWVRENIASFGGDPENITVFGQSAGSMSAQVLVSSDLTRGMVAKAILQSGITCQTGPMYPLSLKEAEEYGKLFADSLQAGSLEELRALPARKIKETGEKWSGRLRAFGKGLLPQPNIDGYVLEKFVGDVWREGKMHPIPYLCGAVNSDLLSEPEEVKAKKPGALIAQCGAWSEKCGEIYGKPAYVYFFAHELPGDEWGAEAFHSSELWYMMGTLARCWRPMGEDDRRLSREMVECWTDFMKTGNPDPQGDKNWRPYEKEEKFIKVFQ